MTKQNKTALVFGFGHLAFRTQQLLKERETIVTLINPDDFVQKKNEGIFNTSEKLLENIDLQNIDFVYIIDDGDDKNIEFLIALNSSYSHSHIAISIFNRSMAEHIKRLHKNLLVVNPGEISSEFFIQALEEDIRHEVRYAPPEADHMEEAPFMPSLLYKTLLAFIGVLVLSILFFHFHNGFRWIDSLYFVVVTIATVGYGDISLLTSDDLSKYVVVLLILVSMVFVAFSFAFIMNELLKKREAILLGIRKYHLKNHIIVCGLGRTGYFVVDKLLDQGHRVIIVEKNQESPYLHYFRSKGAKFYIGDAALSKTLQDVSVSKSKALICLVNNDSKNLEIGLNARSINPGLRLILRIYNKNISEEIKDFFDIQLTFSVSEVTAQHLVGRTL